MARISTYRLDDIIRSGDLLLGSSLEGQDINGNIYKTRNYRLSDLAQFFESYDFTNNISLSEVEGRLSVVEGYGNHATVGYLTAHPNIAAASSVNNSGQFFIQDITLDSNGHILSITSAEASGGGGGGITTETDPIYSASPAAGISASNITNWNTAYSWGDHSTQSYLTTETDPTVASHVKGITVTEVANWNTAYGWGDHSTQGYLTSFTETDPTVASHVKNIASSDITDWTAGYDDSISAISVVNNVVNGVNQKTITLTRRSGSNPISATFTDIAQTGSGGVTDTNDFVTSASLLNGTLTLSIPNQNNVTVSGFSDLSSFSATNNTTATGDGSLAYNSNTGEFIYTPADFSGDFLSINGGTINGDLTVTGIINVNSDNGTSNFENDVSIDGNLSVDGTLTVGTITADLRGDVYSIVGNTASTKVLESGAGSTPTAYFIGDLTKGAGDANMVFDTDSSMFRNYDVKIGDYNNSLGGGAENLDLYLGATSSIFFGSGTAQKELSATIISDFNFAVFSTITGTSFTNGVLTLRTKGADENEPGYSNYTENLQTYFDGRYVELDGDQMTGNLSFDAESIGVVGNILNANGTKILENGSSSQTAYLVGNVAGDIIQSDLSTVIFDSSEDAFTRGINIGVPGTNNIITDNFDVDLGVTSEIYFGRGITSGANQEQYVSGSKISQWNTAYSSWVRDIDFSEPVAGEINITLQQDGTNTRALGTKILEGAGLTFSTSSGQLTMAVDNTEVLFINQLSNNVVTGLSIDEGGSVTNVGSGAIKFIAGNNISLGASGTQKTITINTTSDVLTTSYSKITEWDTAYSSWVRNIKYLTGDGTDVTFTDLNGQTANADSIDIELKGEASNDDRSLSNKIYGSKYINLTADNNENYYSISVDLNELNNTNDDRYVEVAGDTMTGTLTVSGAASFIEGKSKTDLYKNDGTVILDRQNEWFKGDLRGGDLQDASGNNIFTSSNSTFANSIIVSGETITLGTNGVSLSATDISSIKAGTVQSVKFEKTSNEIKLVIDNLTNTDLDSSTVIKGSTYITITEDNQATPNPIISAYTNSDPNNGNLGLATVSYVNTKFASDATAIGWDIDGVTSPTNVNIVLKAEDGLSFVFEADDTNNPNGYDDFTIRNSKGIESFAINDSTGVLTITKTSAGGTPGTLTANLETYVDSRVSAGAAPSLQQVLDSSATANVSTTEIQLVSNTTDNSDVSTHGVLLARRNETSGNNLIATFDTVGNSGHIRIGSDGSNNDATVVYGYLGMSDSGNLFLSNASSTSGGVLIDANDNVGIGLIDNTYKFNVNGTARISETLRVEQITSLQQGINVSGTQLTGAFQVDSTTGHASFAGNLDVDGNTTLDATEVDGAFTALQTSELRGNVTLKADLLADLTSSQRKIGTSNSKFHEIHTSTIFATTLNTTPTVNLVNKTQATTFVDGTSYKNVTAADFILASDVTLKENIIPLSDRKIDVDFKEYNFKGSKRTRFGVIAQEIEEKHPEFVHTREGGDKTVSYIDLLVAKVHELENRIKKLENASTR